MPGINITVAAGGIYSGTAENDGFGLHGTMAPASVSLSIDGLGGTDSLLVGGDWSLDPTSLLTSIERIVIDSTPQFSAPALLPAKLTLWTSAIGEAPAFDLFLDGTFAVNLSGQAFDGSGIVIHPGLLKPPVVEITGTDKSDFITATSGNDTVYGGARADIIKGLGGNDRLFGEAGTDNIQGGDGDDWIDGGLGDDIVVGGIGIDTVSYATLGIGSPEDAGVTVDLRIVGSKQQTGLGGVDTIQGFENLDGSQARDVLVGTNAANRMTGNDGNDRLDGRAGNDVLLGGNGRDVLIGGLGDDRMNGGAGIDAFLFDSAVNQGRDRIDAFTAEDFILTTRALPDVNGDDIIGFGRNGLLNIGTNTAVRMFAENGKAISALEYDGTVDVGGTTYHAYSLIGSETEIAAIFGAS